MSIYIHNKYYKLYFRIVNNAKLLTRNCYTEKHHIIPKSLGGSDDYENLVSLTAREHFICHYLLTKFTINDSFHKMINAFNMMGCTSQSQQRYFNSRLYEANRKHMSKTMSILQSGESNSQYGKIWMTNTIIDVSKKFKVCDINEATAQGWCIGRRSSSFMKKVSISTKPKIKTNVKLFNKLTSSTKPKKVLPKIKTKVKLFNKLTSSIIVISKHFCFDYLIDGWELIKNLPNALNSIRVIYLPTMKNYFLPEHITSILCKNIKWELGFYNPNHKGTAGKTYKVINGKKIFN